MSPAHPDGGRLRAPQVMGPEPSDKECTLGAPCKVTLAGHGLEYTNRLRFVALEDRCGQVARRAAGGPTSHTKAQRTRLHSSSERRNLGKPRILCFDVLFIAQFHGIRIGFEAS